MMMEEKRILLVLDAQGGGLGAQLVRQLGPDPAPGWQLVAVGLNSAATAAMLKAGAKLGATGENAALYNAGRASLIVGPMGIILANGILGEVSPAVAGAVSGCRAKKILIPSASCGVTVAGTQNKRLEETLADAIRLAREYMGG